MDREKSQQTEIKSKEKRRFAFLPLDDGFCVYPNTTSHRSYEYHNKIRLRPKQFLHHQIHHVIKTFAMFSPKVTDLSVCKRYNSCAN